MNEYDIVIVGAGIAGLFTALNIDEKLNILIVSKKEYKECNTSLAQGGIAASPIYENESDNIELHIKDTLRCGHETNNINAVEALTKDSFKIIKDLEKFGVEFDKDKKGRYDLGLEGGHSANRIYHHKDYTGYEVETKLIDKVKEKRNITLKENTQLADVKKVKGGFIYRFLEENNKILIKKSNVCILATGGIGKLYPYTTNSKIATGDGIAFAYLMGAKIKNLSKVQFHPTAFRTQDSQSFLITEALRGAGAKLKNSKMERFMKNYDKRMELAPRDIISSAMIKEEKRLNSDKFYIDIKDKPKEEIKSKFPMIYKNLLNYGYDLTKDLIPVYPCQHYLMGGIDVDLNSKTNIDNLYAVGECAHTGVHGENRLASNSLLEAAVFGKRAAVHINQNFKKEKIEDGHFKTHSKNLNISKETNEEIRRIIKDSDFIIKDKYKAQLGFLRIKDINFLLQNGKFKITNEYITTKSMAICAYLILKELI